MNKNLRNLLAACCLLVMVTSGCNQDPKTTGYQVAGVTINTVDAAMNTWGDYVRAGLATGEQQASVRKAYGAYLSAVSAAKVAVETAYADPGAKQDAITSALQMVSASSSQLITLIETLTNK